MLATAPAPTLPMPALPESVKGMTHLQWTILRRVWDWVIFRLHTSSFHPPL